MTLYLCKMDPNEVRRGEPKFVAMIGRIVGDDESGYRFLPNVSGHKSSRKFHKDALKCIPRWTDSCGYTRLLDEKELRAAQNAEGK